MEFYTKKMQSKARFGFCRREISKADKNVREALVGLIFPVFLPLSQQERKCESVSHWRVLWDFGRFSGFHGFVKIAFFQNIVVISCVTLSRRLAQFSGFATLRPVFFLFSSTP